jgi:hypothetical protein
MMFGIRFGGLLLGGIALVAGIGSAHASTVVQVPEPTVMSLIAAGAAGAAVLYRIRRKK